MIETMIIILSVAVVVLVIWNLNLTCGVKYVDDKEELLYKTLNTTVERLNEHLDKGATSSIAKSVKDTSEIKYIHERISEAESSTRALAYRVDKLEERTPYTVVESEARNMELFKGCLKATHELEDIIKEDTEKCFSEDKVSNLSVCDDKYEHCDECERRDKRITTLASRIKEGQLQNQHLSELNEKQKERIDSLLDSYVQLTERVFSK